MAPLLQKKNTSEGSYTDGRRPGPNLSRLKGKHFLYKDTSVRKPCVVCYSMKSADNNRKDTKVSTCCQKCKDTCFENFHFLVNYSILSQDALHKMLDLYSVSRYINLCAFTVNVLYCVMIILVTLITLMILY